MKNFYNDNVGSYNKKIQMFPTNLVAKFMKYNPDVIIP
ncbi:MAG: LemA family protein [Bacilli bacterium]|nr:LemA family protein [Bacilli bacterium]